ncbi:hypothetical protein [Galbibacter pacificus]|uniref:Uncharacterized protein n=1 Tax=Galbibacter pacificus TaxID=2996052 RepID=A0ABT6FMA4_9FLAO|nr:hypothetical protein [Galbibacter pacificus]MDG3580918.1 hypothetical protein [Galbibacter pacificus]MDG3584396.1 hypothetical protein [Galbibacter pacificus]
MKKTFTLLLTILFLQSCALGGDREQIVSVEDRYTLAVPSFLSKANDLNNDASLQYMNGIREFYVVVIDEPKDGLQQLLDENDLSSIYNNDIDSYADISLNILSNSINSPVHGEVVDTLINSMPARLTTLKGEIDGIDVFYYIGAYEGIKNYYQVLSWTLASRESTHKQRMNKVLCSLKETHPRKKY